MTLLASHCFLNGRLHPVFLDVTNEKTSFSKNRLKFQQLPAFSFMKKQVGNLSGLCNTMKSLQHEHQISIQSFPVLDDVIKSCPGLLSTVLNPLGSPYW